MRLENKKILITGAAGFLGSKIVETLLDEKAYCLLLDKNYEQLKKIKFRLNQKNYYNFSIFKDSLKYFCNNASLFVSEKVS